MHRSLLIALLLIARQSLAAPPADPPSAESGQASEHLRRGLGLYEQGDYAGAIAEFERGWVIDPDPAFLYGLGQAERKRGHCRKAIEHYTAFLASGPPAMQERAARLQISRCQAELAARPRQTARLTAAVVHEPVAWYRDWTGDALVAGGLLAAAVGAAVAQSAHRDIERAGDSYPALEEAQDAPSRRTAGLVAVGAGTGLVALGVLHYAFWRPTRRVVLEPAATGVVAWLLVEY